MWPWRRGKKNLGSKAIAADIPEPAQVDTPQPVNADRDAYVAGTMVFVRREPPFVPSLPPDDQAGDSAFDRVRVGRIPGRAAHFQHRPEQQILGQALAGGNAAVLTQVIAGMGGIGKTQLAADYAARAWELRHVDVLVWVTATSRDPVVTGYAEAAHEVGIAARREGEAAATAFLNWLADTDQRWLVVLDDVSSVNALAELLPPGGRRNGRVIITTRLRDAAIRAVGQMVPIGLFTAEQSLAYLTASLAGLPDVDGVQVLAAAVELAVELGHLPIGLAQATAYIGNKQITCAEYLRRFMDQTRQLPVPEPGSLPDGHQLTVDATLRLSVAAADGMHPRGLASRVLRLAGVLDPSGVPTGAFTSRPGLRYLASAGEAAGRADEVTAEHARDALANLHTLHAVDLAADRVRTHALVQRAITDQLNDSESVATVLAAADSLLAIWPAVESDQTHAQLLRSNSGVLRGHHPDPLWASDAHPLLFLEGRSFGEAGLVSTALNHFTDLHDDASHRLGPDHPDTLRARDNIARWRGEAGDAVGAVAAFEALLAEMLRVLGPDHPDTLTTRHHVAHWRGQAGDAVGAVAAFEALLAEMLRVLGPDHPETLRARNNITYWRGQAGDAVGAVAASEAVLPDMLRVLGPDHPDTLAARNNIAYWHGTAGDAAGAVQAFEALLPDMLRVLGPDHPDTLRARDNIAFWHGKAGDAPGAVTAFDALLPDMLRVLGPDHPDTLRARANFAGSRGEAGDAAAAVAAFDALLPDMLRVLGPDHPDTLATRNNSLDWSKRAGMPTADQVPD